MIILERIRDIDHLIFQVINGFAFKWLWLDSLGIFLANYLIYFLVFFLLLFLLKFKKYCQPKAGQPKAERMVLKALIAAVISRFVIVEFIRWIYPRSRPFVGENINLLVDKVNQFSFPSGHASFAFGLATVVYLYNKKWGATFLILAFVISIARVFVGVHWPLDVLAGAVVGILSGYLVHRLFAWARSHTRA